MNLRFIKLIGYFNKNERFIKSIFLAYPANEDFSFSYINKNVIDKIKWNPYFSGIMFQDSQLIFMFAVSATEIDFLNKDNRPRLTSLYEKMMNLGESLNVSRITFAGRLPGILKSCRIVKGRLSEVELTVGIVVESIKLTFLRCLLKENTPIVVLGGKGFIGKRVMELLVKNNCQNKVYSVDLLDGNPSVIWNNLSFNTPPLILNVSVDDVINGYLDKIPVGSTVLNEVYPEPSNEMIQALKSKACRVFHIVGVKGRVLPKLPGAYGDGIPCCAAWDNPMLRPVIKEL